MSIDPQDALRLLVTGLALVVFAVAFLSYLRRPTLRTLLITGAFGVYVLKGLLLTSDLVFPEHGNLLDSLGIVADAAFLLLIAAAFLKA
ncbi:MAG: hypothetical protein ACYDCK_02485 [Thermoplasmatota archaeon]